MLIRNESLSVINFSQKINVPQRTLSDIRDNNTYTVRKLADGNVWMVENLRLVGSRTLTPSDSDVVANFTLPAQNTGTWCTTNDTACINTANNLSSGNTTYGTYYSWYAATAGTGTYETTSGNAQSSVCPRGWRLPKNDGSASAVTNEFQALYDQYNSNANMRDTTNGPGFVLAGRRIGDAVGNQGNGYYWSSTAYGADCAYGLFLNSVSVAPVSYYGRFVGPSVRCLAK